MQRDGFTAHERWEVHFSAAVSVQHRIARHPREARCRRGNHPSPSVTDEDAAWSDRSPTATHAAKIDKPSRHTEVLSK